MTDSVFTKIINREIPADIVWENDQFIAILDIRPLRKGHTLLIPKVQIDKFYDLDDLTYQKLFEYAKKFAPIIEKAFNSIRTGMVLEGFGIPHVHIHLFPMERGNSIDTHLNYEASREELKEAGLVLKDKLKDIK